jgi:hypothetical protein
MNPLKLFIIIIFSDHYTASFGSKLRGAHQRGTNPEEGIKQTSPTSQQWDKVPATFCTSSTVAVANNVNGRTLSSTHASKHSRTASDDPLCQRTLCPTNSFCFLGTCPCHPGYTGARCEVKLEVANPWYTKSCPNLQMQNTIDINLPLALVGGEHTRLNSSTTTPLNSETLCVSPAHPKRCAYLCYSHPTYGAAVVPTSLWQAAQQAEGNLWAQVGNYQMTSDANDRAQEHWKAYQNFIGIPKNYGLGQVIEVGAGPWTQFKGILHVRPDLVQGVSRFTVWEPGANRYAHI